MHNFIHIDKIKRLRGTDAFVRLDAVRKSDIRGFLENHFITWDNATIAVSSFENEPTGESTKVENFLVVFVHKGPLRGRKSSDSFLKTKFSKIDVQYYEYWQESEDHYVLERIYINFYYILENERVNIFSLHVDPLKKKNYPIYESIPHYHFYLTPRPLSKMHIPLDLINGLECTEKYSTLKQVLNAAVKALSKELETRHRVEDNKMDKFLRAFKASEER
jgi:hypothetical protein